MSDPQNIFEPSVDKTGRRRRREEGGRRRRQHDVGPGATGLDQLGPHRERSELGPGSTASPHPPAKGFFYPPPLTDSVLEILAPPPPPPSSGSSCRRDASRYPIFEWHVELGVSNSITFLRSFGVGEASCPFSSLSSSLGGGVVVVVSRLLVSGFLGLEEERNNEAEAFFSYEALSFMLVRSIRGE